MSKFYVEDSKKETMEKAKLTQAPGTRERQRVAPPGYLKVNLSSLDKLSTPPVIHVRDYTGEDAFKLGLVEDSRLYETLISVVDKMIYEDINAQDLHENELVEIMLNVFVNFWSSHITDYPFPLTDEDWDLLPEDRKERLEKRQETLSIDLDIAQLKTSLISKEFQEPIHIKKDKLDVGFILPRVGHLAVTKEYVLSSFRRESEEFHRVENILNYNAKLSPNDVESKKYVDPLEIDKFDAYIESKLALTNKVHSAQTIFSVNGKELKTLEEKLEAFDKIEGAVWLQLNKVVDKHSGFGVDNDVEMKSPINGELVTRRCRFQLLELIPNAKSRGDDEYAVSFG